jgi:hypothetical protein
MEISMKVASGSGCDYGFGALLFRLERQIGINTFVERVQGARLLKAPPPFCETAYTPCCAIV